MIQNPLLETKKILNETFHNLNLESNASKAIPSTVTTDATKAYSSYPLKSYLCKLIKVNKNLTSL